VRAPLEDAVERMALERVAEFEVGVEHGVGLDVAVHAGAERAALEAVAAQQPGVDVDLPFPPQFIPLAFPCGSAGAPMGAGCGGSGSPVQGFCRWRRRMDRSQTAGMADVCSIYAR
jgi:hypothetical protein